MVVFEFSARATASLTIFGAGFETARRTERGATAWAGLKDRSDSGVAEGDLQTEFC